MTRFAMAIVFALTVIGCVEAENTDTGPQEAEDCTTEFAWSYCLDPYIESTDTAEQICSYSKNMVVIWTDDDEVRHARWCISHEEVCLSACGGQE